MQLEKLSQKNSLFEKKFRLEKNEFGQKKIHSAKLSGRVLEDVEGTGVTITFDCDIHVRETFETSGERIWLFPPPRTLISVFTMSCIPHFGQNLKMFSK